MKTFVEAKSAYVKDHLSKPLKTPNRQLIALENIEVALKEKDKSLLDGGTIFENYNESSMVDFYLRLRGKRLNTAEKSVIHGL